MIPVGEVVTVLQAGGRLQYDVAEREALLRGPLRCHRCGAGARNMPDLRAHLAAGCAS
jgi:aprataxin